MRRTRARPKTPFHMTIALTYMKSCNIHLLPKGFASAYLWAKVCVCVWGGGGGGGSWYRYVYTARSTVGHNKVVRATRKTILGTFVHNSIMLTPIHLVLVSNDRELSNGMLFIL